MAEHIAARNARKLREIHPLYALFWSTKGFDDWAWNVPDKNRLALTEFFLDICLPIGAGASVMLRKLDSPAVIGPGHDCE